MSAPPAPAGAVGAPGLELRELECFLVLSEELHFGRTGERLYVSQSRVSQLLRSLESRIGARLVDRTSRRVRLTPLGEEFRASLRPAYDALRATVDSARTAARGIEGRLTIGFQGTADDRIMRAIGAFHTRHPRCVTQIVEVPLCDPFGALRSGAVDVAVTLLPVAEPDLVLGPVFSAQQQTVALSVRHPLAVRAALTAEELAGLPLISPDGPAPVYWRTAQAPTATPEGRPIPAGPRVSTLQEGLTLTAAGQGGMLLCRPTAEYHGRRDVVFVPVTGLPHSALGVVHHAARETARVRAFATTVRDVTAVTSMPSEA
ncbi:MULTISPECIES: LysR family transcriptional regulator [unclassified Streptomyces]|uniref:LysR family transcriptional regulator n=1 Tax=unclassified Streptomyces TaxID=2593676 RepID=UPI000370695D|nr:MULTISPECIES: LysR family transcriptional regulator [unclassified Streptomyces]MYT32543.1 LysR family transcriptional regulator [Streptomyces sp. SID8354]